MNLVVRYHGTGFKPDRYIIVALTANEEGGGPYNGIQWLKKVIADDQVALKVDGEVAPGPASPMRPDVLKAVKPHD